MNMPIIFFFIWMTIPFSVASTVPDCLSSLKHFLGICLFHAGTLAPLALGALTGILWNAGEGLFQRETAPLKNAGNYNGAALFLCSFIRKG